MIDTIMQKFYGEGTKYHALQFYGYCMNVKAKVSVEIGVGGGIVSALLTYAAYQNKGIHYAIDIDKDKLTRLKQPLTVWGYKDSIRTINKDSKDIIWKGYTKNAIDFLFIDSSHEYEATKKELEIFMPYIRQKGCIALHDYVSKSGVKKAVDKHVSKKYWDKFLSDDMNKYGYEAGVMICKKK